MVTAREDVERLFVFDRLPDYVVVPRYDTDAGPCVEITLDPIYNTRLMALAELRTEIVRTITDVRDMGFEPIEACTLIAMHEYFGNRDMVLRSLLVNTEMVPLLEGVPAAGFWGRVNIFAHPEVPIGDLYGLADPEFVGVIPYQDGIPGVGLTNPHGIVWGRFKTIYEV